MLKSGDVLQTVCHPNQLLLSLQLLVLQRHRASELLVLLEHLIEMRLQCLDPGLDPTLGS